MSRYIDEELVVEALQSCIDTDGIYDENNGIDYISHDEAVKYISEIPTADVKPVVHGEWERETFDLGADIPIRVAYQCSECGNYFDSEFNFCPHCGSDMRGK